MYCFEAKKCNNLNCPARYQSNPRCWLFFAGKSETNHSIECKKEDCATCNYRLGWEIGLISDSLFEKREIPTADEIIPIEKRIEDKTTSSKTPDASEKRFCYEINNCNNTKCPVREQQIFRCFKFFEPRSANEKCKITKCNRSCENCFYKNGWDIGILNENKFSDIIEKKKIKLRDINTRQNNLIVEIYMAELAKKPLSQEEEYELAKRIAGDKKASELFLMANLKLVTRIAKKYSDKMPLMDGFDVMCEMKADPLLCNTPVVVVTASDDTDNQIRALDLGAYDVLFKPLNTRLVIHRVHNIFTQMTVNTLNEPEILYRHIIAQSEIDEKSGIFNRSKFIKEAEKLLNDNPGRKYYMLMWDVDGFKILNDSCGTSEGDRLLAAMGKACKEIAVPGSVYGRWEADHFVACVDEETFRTQKIKERILEAFDFDNPNFVTQLRLGIYSIDEPNVHVRIMCDRALMALKSTKGSYTRHHAFFDESMRAQLMHERRVVNECATALENGQFVVYLQPQYDYSNRVLHGAEALVRWIHPKAGLISPGEFIPIFEKNGFITKLDEYVWECVCRLQREWLDEGIKIVPISVNVSRVDISHNYLFDYLETLMTKYELPREALRLEITESAYMDNPKQLITAVKRLQKMGFSVEMDDFGSGFSSLNTLKDVPVDMLKLDMRFLEHGENDERGGSILSSRLHLLIHSRRSNRNRPS